jgi:hypothetical protein
MTRKILDLLYPWVCAATGNSYVVYVVRSLLSLKDHEHLWATNGDITV